MLKIFVSISLLLSPLCNAQFEEDLPYAFEAVTGFRSNYIHRGNRLAKEIVDFQLNGVFEYDDTRYLEFGIWNAGEQNKGDFSELGVMLDYTERLNDWSYGTGFHYRHLRNSVFESGFELDFTLTRHLHPDHYLVTTLSYDTEAEGFYNSINYQGYKDLSEKTSLAFQLGASFTHDYYRQKGFNDLFGRLALTYNVNEHITITPYIGFSGRSGSSDIGYAGFWFATNF